MEINLQINDDFFKFIKEHIVEDPVKLRLKYYNSQLPFDVMFAITQIECRQRTKKKLPEILNHQNFIFPTKLLSEQSTDEIVAKLHSELFEECNYVVDMTAGLCIDTYYISKNVKHVLAIEMDVNAAKVAEYNISLLSKNISVICADSTEYILDNDIKADAIFVDPARRDNNKNRVYNLADCSPNIIDFQQELKNRCDFAIVKASPMIDITDTIRRIHNISNIYIIGLKNECKEILFKIDFKSQPESVNIKTINYVSDGVQRFDYIYESTTKSPINSAPIKDSYLYEPNCCIMKSGAYNILSERHNINPISDNTHIFTSTILYSDFPGRIFNIEKVLPYKKNKMKGFNKIYPQINIATRNFPYSPEVLKKELKIKDGGDKYLFGITCQDKTPLLLICSKVSV